MNNIKSARLAAGLTQQAMSEKMGIPKRTIENWEQGSRQCPEWAEKLIIEKLEGKKMNNEAQKFINDIYDTASDTDFSNYTIEDAKTDLENFRRDGYDVPEDLTAEELCSGLRDLYKRYVIEADE